MKFTLEVSSIGCLYSYKQTDLIVGPTLFNGYLNNEEQTVKVFANINGQIYLKTGDLARYNARGELVHVGRIDFQIKIRGQRVETTEIENTIINFSPDKISNCLVIKAPQNDDSLVAYIISSDPHHDIRQIRAYCERYLRQYMVPSYFVVLDKLPVNATGKIDRKQLPAPVLYFHTPSDFTETNDQPTSELEAQVHQLWCFEFRLRSIPRHMNCFALGGSSLLLMQLFNKYQAQLTPDKQLNVLDFFINSTIANHTQLLIKSKPTTTILWHPLHLLQGTSS